MAYSEFAILTSFLSKKLNGANIFGQLCFVYIGSFIHLFECSFIRSFIYYNSMALLACSFTHLLLMHSL